MARHRSPRRRPFVAGLVLALLALPGPAGAAEVELGVIGGVQQTGDLTSREGTLDLAAGPLYGVAVGWRVQPDGIVEIAWTRQDSEASGDLTTGRQEFDVTIDTVELGGLWETRIAATRPFLGLSVGSTRLAGPDQELGDGWYLSGAISGGARWFLGERAILRLEGRATGILLTDGGAIACSFPPGGCSLGLTGSPLGAFSARASIAARF